MKSKRALLLCLSAALVLTGCQSAPAVPSAATLPPAAVTLPAPEGEEGLSYEGSAVLYLPSRDGQYLLAQYEPLTLTHLASAAQSVVKALLAFEGNDLVTDVGGGVALSLYGPDPVEVSGGVCTINLASSALQLEREPFYTACLSLAATLCELDGIHYVNVLVADQAVGLDLTGYLPAGGMTAHPGEELPVLREQMEARKTPLGEAPALVPLTGVATLYFPLADGSGVIPEARNLSFSGQTPQQLASGLLAALSAGAQYAKGACVMPDLNALMVYAPQVSELADTGGRLVTLTFVRDLDAQLKEAGVDASCFISAVALTLCTYIPSVAAVQVMVGDTLLTSLYSASHGMLNFEGGLIRRSAFAAYRMSQATLYFPSGDRLKATLRALPERDACNPQSLLACLFTGPTAAESDSGLESILPAGFDESDVLGIALTDDTLTLNLSAGVRDAVAAMDDRGQRLFCYSLVNTLCQSKSLRRVRFFFDGQSVETLGGQILWGGEFLLCPGLIDGTLG